MITFRFLALALVSGLINLGCVLPCGLMLFATGWASLCLIGYILLLTK